MKEQINIVPLDEIDIKVFLNRRREFILIGLWVIVPLSFTLWIMVLALKQANLFNNTIYIYSIFSLTIILLIIVIYYFNKYYNSDLRVGNKLITNGTIIKKRIETRFGFHMNFLVDGFKKLSPAYTSYYLTINDKEFEVKKETFDFLDEGESIKIHKSIKSGYVLRYEKE